MASRRDAGRNRHDQVIRRDDGRKLGEQRIHVLGLDREHDRVGLMRGVGVAHRLHAVALREFVRPIFVAFGDDEVVGAGACLEQAGDQRLPHLARTDHRDHLLTHRLLATAVIVCSLPLSSFARYRSKEERKVRGPLGQPAHEIRI